jgi:hypothetical protein
MHLCVPTVLVVLAVGTLWMVVRQQLHSASMAGKLMGNFTMLLTFDVKMTELFSSIAMGHVSDKPFATSATKFALTMSMVIAAFKNSCIVLGNRPQRKIERSLCWSPL